MFVMPRTRMTRIFALTTCSVLLCLVSGQNLDNGANCFTLNLYKKLAAGQTNVVSSPFSADVLLSMLMVGAGGSTADDLTKVLGYKDLPLADMQKAFKAALSALHGSNGTTLNIANSMWIQDTFKVKQPFVDSATKYFDAEVKNVDFENQPHLATSTINDWASNKTQGLIPTLFDSDLDSSTLVMLVNAIYFKGQWAKKFNKLNTKEGQFFGENPSSGTSKPQLMNLLHHFSYTYDTTLQAQVLEMKYKGDDISMIVILPKKGSKFSDLEDALTCEMFNSGLLSPDFEELVDVTLPKFEVNSYFQLQTPLESVGLARIFKEREANFTGVTDMYGFRVTKAIQKAVVKVNEEGSEAAAVTAIGCGRKRSVLCATAVAPPPIKFTADHPFLYLIRHNPTKLILFFGRVKNLP